MRESLKKSAADSPVKGFERYRAGSIVICQSCSLPIFKLDRDIVFGDGAGKAVSAFKPLDLVDVTALIAREDIDAGLRVKLADWTQDELKAHCAKLCEMRAGDPMICPVCYGVFVQVISVDKHEVLDKAYTIEMLTISPVGFESSPIRGRRIGYGRGRSWVH